MPNIFDGLSECSKKDIILQIALLEISSLKIVSKPMINKATRGFAKVTKYISNFIIKDSVIEYSVINEEEVLEIESLIREKEAELKFLSKEELENRFFNIIKKKVGFEEAHRASKDVIAIKMINEAASVLNLHLKEMPSVKAGKVYDLFYDYIISRASSYGLNSKNEENKDFFENFLNLKEDNRNKVLNVLNIEKKVLSTTSYIASNGSKNIDREFLALIVWLLLIINNGDSFMPSLSEFKVEYDTELEVKYSKLVKKSNNGNFIINMNNKKILQLNASIKDSEIVIQKENKKKQDALNQIKALKDKIQDNCLGMKKKANEVEKVKEEYEIAIKSVDELDEENKMKIKKVLFDVQKQYDDVAAIVKGLKNQFEYNEKLIGRAELDVENKQKEIIKLKKNIKELTIENESIENTKEDIKKKVIDESKRRKEQLIKRWESTFINYLIDSSVYEQACLLDSKELIFVELALIEINKIEDKIALSMGIEDNIYNYVIINETNRDEIKIVYEILNANNALRIVSITKVN